MLLRPRRGPNVTPGMRCNAVEPPSPGRGRRESLPGSGEPKEHDVENQRKEARVPMIKQPPHRLPALLVPQLIPGGDRFIHRLYQPRFEVHLRPWATRVSSGASQMPTAHHWLTHHILT